MLPKTEAVFSPVDFSTDSVRWKLQERRNRLVDGIKNIDSTN